MRSKKIEYAILKPIITDHDPDGYAFILGDLFNIVARSVPDASHPELVDAIKRLSDSRVLEPWKWSDRTQRFEPYDGSGDDGFFYRGDFRLKKTPDSQPYFEQLEQEVGPEPQKRKIGF